MDNIPYDMWAEYLYSILTEYGITEGTLLELGCGTGSMTECMIAKGYDSIIGLDSSEDMLMMARGSDTKGKNETLSSVSRLPAFIICY